MPGACLAIRALRARIGWIALAWPVMAGAGDWYTLAVSDQTLIVVDRNSAAYAAHGGTVQEVQIYAHTKAITGAAQPVRRLDIALQMDCRHQRLRPTGFSVRNQAGVQLMTWQADADQAQWQAPETGSANAFLLDAVCARKWDPARLRKGADILQVQRLYLASVTGQ